jgi:hypothetical protein
MAYGFQFVTGPGVSGTQVFSDEVAPGFIVSAVTRVPLTVTSITNVTEGVFGSVNYFSGSEMICNSVATSGTFQPGLMSGYLKPNIGSIVSGPGLPDNCQVVDQTSISGSTIGNGMRFILNKQILGSASTAVNAYTLTTLPSFNPVVGYPDDAINTNNSTITNNQRPYPDTIIDFSGSPFNQHDIIVYPPSYFDGRDLGTFGYNYLLMNARIQVYVDQINKIAYANYFRQATNVNTNIQLSSGNSTSITLSSGAVIYNQDQYIIGPNINSLGIRVTAGVSTATNVIPVDGQPTGGWNTSATYFLIPGGDWTQRLLLGNSGSASGSYILNPNAGCWWETAVIGRNL